MNPLMCRSLAFYICLIINYSVIVKIHNSIFNNYSISDGLTDNIVHFIFQDSHRWIWAGTSYGVMRFNGYKFEKFSVNDQASKILVNRW